jgi:hypothetical protein
MFDENFMSCINTKGIKCHTLPPLIGGELYFVYKLFVVTGIMIKTFTLKTEELSCASQSQEWRVGTPLTGLTSCYGLFVFSKFS